MLGSVSSEFLPNFQSQIWVSDVTFVTFFGDKKSHFWGKFDVLAHDFFFSLWRLLSHPSRKSSHFGPAGTKLFWTGRNVTIQLGMKHVFVFPSQICLLSQKRAAGRPFGLGPTLNRGNQNLKLKKEAQRAKGGCVCCGTLDWCSILFSTTGTAPTADFNPSKKLVSLTGEQT